MYACTEFDITTHGMHRLDGLGHQRLQREALERQAHARQAITTLVLPAADDADAPARGSSPREVSSAATAPDASRRMPVTSQFSMMSTPSASRRARVAPGDGIVPGRAAAALQRRAQDRVADVRARC